MQKLKLFTTFDKNINIMSKKDTYCKSYSCKRCIHYAPHLTCNTMHTICWNKNNWFEEDNNGFNKI